MSRQNRYLQDVRREAHRLMERYVRTLAQAAADSAAIAANDVFSMGPTRAPAFSAAFNETFLEIVRLINEDGPDCQYAFAKIDQRLQQIYGDNFQPAEVRYARDC